MLNKIIVLLIFSLNTLFPCAVCYGNPEAPMAKGMSMGVLTLIGFIGFVLFVIAYSIVSIAIRSKNNNSLGDSI